MIDDNLIATLKLGFSSSISKIRIPSLGDKTREYAFREPTVKEVNTISRITLSNSDTQSTIYASSLVFLKYLCLDDDFNPYMMNEIDRLKVVTFILSGIFFSKNLTINCPKVGCNNTFPYSLKYGDIIKKLDEFSSRKFVFENSTSAGNVKVTAGFPRADRYLEFLEFVDGIRNKPVDYKSFNDSFVEIDSTVSSKSEESKNTSPQDSDFISKIRRRKEILKGHVNDSVNENKTVLGNVDIKQHDYHPIKRDMSYLYIKNMLITNIPNSKDDFTIDCDGLSYEDSLKIMDVIPMRLFMMENDEINFLDYILVEMEKSLNECTPEIICSKCGNNISKKLGIQNFFIRG